MNPGMPLMPLLLSCSRGSCLFIICGRRLHVCAACRTAPPKYMFSPCFEKVYERRFHSKCVMFCITGNGRLIFFLLIQVSQKYVFFSWGIMIPFLTQSKCKFVNIEGCVSLTCCFWIDPDYFCMTSIICMWLMWNVQHYTNLCSHSPIGYYRVILVCLSPKTNV